MRKSAHVCRCRAWKNVASTQDGVTHWGPRCKVLNQFSKLHFSTGINNSRRNSETAERVKRGKHCHRVRRVNYVTRILVLREKQTLSILVGHILCTKHSHVDVRRPLERMRCNFAIKTRRASRVSRPRVLLVAAALWPLQVILLFTCEFSFRRCTRFFPRASTYLRTGVGVSRHSGRMYCFAGFLGLFGNFHSWVWNGIFLNFLTIEFVAINYWDEFF